MAEASHQEKVQRFQQLVQYGQQVKDTDPVKALSAFQQAKELFPTAKGIDKWIQYLEVMVKRITPAPTTSTQTSSTQSQTAAPTQQRTATPAPTQQRTATPAPTAQRAATPAPTQQRAATPAPTTQRTATPAPTTQRAATPAPAQQRAATPAPAQQRAATPAPTTQRAATPAPAQQRAATPAPATQRAATPQPATSATPAPAASAGSLDQEQIKQWVRQAEKEVKANNIEGAVSFMDQALQMLRTHNGPKKTLLKLLERRNKISASAACLFEAAEIFVEQGDEEGARKRLELAVRKDPAHLPSLKLKVELARNSGQSHQLLASLMQLSDGFEKNGDFKAFDDLQKQIREVKDSLQ
ncbi:MAG: hypothetical protein CL920_39245 [Deltaproteobacteria bacterium]|nr:hypothetical protein [Deltaproteobacteria bacterium]MBU54772.1 hypothetical protein [Deltaproteobacteria bacterium]